MKTTAREGHPEALVLCTCGHRPLRCTVCRTRHRELLRLAFEVGPWAEGSR